MTQEQQDAAWRSLPEDYKEEVCKDYANAKAVHELDPTNERIDMHIIFLEKYFGKHNLTATEEEKPLKGAIHKLEEELQELKAKHLDEMLHPEKYCTCEVTLDKISPNWLAYRMELAKEIAVAMIEATQSFDADRVMTTVDGIIERLKGGFK